MSEGMPITDLFKSSPEVTSLATTDRILAFDTNGNPKKIASSVVADSVDLGGRRITHKGWVRIAQGVASAGVTGVISVVTAQPNQVALMIRLAVGQAAGHAKKSIEVFGSGFSSNFTTPVITKLRMWKPISSAYPFYIDIYLAQSRTVTVRKSCDINLLIAGMSQMEVSSPQRFSEPYEYDLSEVISVWGG